MIQSPERDRFLINYFRWACAEFDREVDDDFLLLRTVNHPLNRIFLDYVEGRPSGTVRVLGRGLVKRFHKRAVELSGAVLTEEEADALAEWDPIRDRRIVRLPIGARDGLTIPGKGPISEAWTREILSERLTKVCGPGAQWDPHQWRYERTVDACRVRTNIDMSGQRAELTYSHSLDRGDRPSTLREGIALLSWLGLCGETTWRVWEESDVMPVANGLVACCERFVGGLPKMLVGV